MVLICLRAFHFFFLVGIISFCNLTWVDFSSFHINQEKFHCEGLVSYQTWKFSASIEKFLKAEYGKYDGGITELVVVTASFGFLDCRALVSTSWLEFIFSLFAVPNGTAVTAVFPLLVHLHYNGCFVCDCLGNNKINTDMVYITSLNFCICSVNVSCPCWECLCWQ